MTDSKDLDEPRKETPTDPQRESSGADSPRPSIDDSRQLSYNRITIPTSLKSQICSLIAESTESLPLPNWSTAAYDGSHDNPSNTSDMPTPVPEKENPLENLPLDKHKTAIPLSTVSTAQSSASDGKKDRPGTLRRLTTRIRRTMSSNPSPSTK